ncbi:MAG: amidohydrolase [Crocinitomicaceae bacterium]
MKYLFSSLLLILFFSFQSCMKGESVDLVIHNAQVHTMNSDGDIFDAIAIKDGKIVEVGPERQILNRYSADEYIDAGLKDIYPGLTDGHGHLLSYARMQLGVNLFGCESYQEMIVRIKKYQARHNRTFIIGAGWDQSLWDEDSELPTKEMLDSVFPDVPVALIRIDGHSMLANDTLLKSSKVIEIVNAAPEKYAGGHFLYNEDGTPTGMIIDNAMKPIYDLIPAYPKEELNKTIKGIQAELFSYGVTGVHDAGLSAKDRKIIENWVNDRTLKLNIYGMLLPDEENMAFAEKNGIYENKNLYIRSFKVYGDGAVGSRGAFMKEEYSDRHGHFGHLTTPMNEIKRIADFCEKIGYQMNTHAIGDSTNRLILELCADAYTRNNDYRWRIEHAQHIDPNDFELFERSRAYASVQPTHATTDQRWAVSRLGEERMHGSYAYRTLLEKCGLLVIGTDFPVEYTDPFRTIHSATNRKTVENYPMEGFLPEEAITLEECLKGMTIWAAFGSFQETKLGTLEEGKDATLVIFNEAIVDRPTFKNNFANTVFIGGEKVYSVE